MLYKIIFFYSLFLVACSSKEQIVEKEKPDWNTEKSTQMNKDFLIEEDLRIEMYLKQRKDWKAQKTGSGLRYYIFKAGTGKLAETGMVASVKYKIELLNGDLCYQTEADEVEKFKIDNSEVETGIQEAIKLLHVGDHAKLILPSHIAHGLTGDLNKIPPLSTLVIELELIGLK